MINTAYIEYVDVNQKFFEIDNIDFEKLVCVFDDEKGLRVTMNYVVSKTEAIKKAHQIFAEKQNEYTNLYVSVDSMKVEHIKDYMGEKIFKKLPDDISGWVFLFDPIPFANWEHPCEYLLIVNEDCFERTDYQRGVSDTVRLEKIY